MNDEPQFSAEWHWSQKFLHWLMALLIFVQIGLGVLMEYWKPDVQTSFVLIQTHKSIGFSVLLLVCLRLLVRLRYGSPPLPATLPAWERWLARAVQALLYAALIVLPLTGWLTSSAEGFPTRPFGLFTLPDLLDRNRELGMTLRFIHGTLAGLVVALLMLHIAGALKHHFWSRNDILRRMLPRRWSRTPPSSRDRPPVSR